MAQDSKVAIIGGGASGCTCAYFLQNDFDITVFDFQPLLATILRTGGGRCNLAYNEPDFKILAENYPRGEKFLYSIFSKFSLYDTLNLFDKLGIETYSQEDKRFFPKSDNAKNLREKFLKNLKHINHIKQKVIEIKKINQKFVIITQNNEYNFDKIIYSTGGHHGYDPLKMLGIPIIPPRPSLVGLITKENFSNISGVTISNVKSNDLKITGDILFTHKGISGPLIYKISALKARDSYPYELSFDLLPDLDNFQNLLETNSLKQVKTLLSEFMPKSLAEFILKKINSEETVCHEVTKEVRKSILNNLHNLKVKVLSSKPDGETVTSGGVDLKSINPTTLESKLISGLYFCGEVLDIDGFCGGFNLQNCWSTAYVISDTLLKNRG